MANTNKPSDKAAKQAIDDAAAAFAKVLEEQLPDSTFKHILIQRIQGFAKKAERALVDPPRIQKIKEMKTRGGNG